MSGGATAAAFDGLRTGHLHGGALLSLEDGREQLAGMDGKRIRQLDELQHLAATLAGFQFGDVAVSAADPSR